MGVSKRLVNVPMRVRSVGVNSLFMFMLMMLIMYVAVAMFYSLMGVFKKENITWNNGERVRSRSGRISSTNFSNGTSWCS